MKLGWKPRLLAFALFIGGIVFISAIAANNNAEMQSDISLPGKTSDIRKLLKDPIFVACKEKATPVGKEGFLGVCTRHDDISGETDTVIYDSTDEILLQPSRHSKVWKDIAENTTAPFGTKGVNVEKIADHYYRVVFWNEQAPNDWSIVTHLDKE